MVDVLFAKRNNGQLIVWRILFGVILFFECAGAIAVGWVDDVFVKPPIFRFTFIGFEWLNAIPLTVIYALYAFMALLGLAIAFGYRYRFSIILITFLWVILYLSHKSFYNNHHYLMGWILLIMCFLPAHHRFSLDVKYKKVDYRNTCENWNILIFIFLLLVVYTYASIAKVYPDWMNGEPIRHWFSNKKSIPIIGGIYAWEHTPILFAWTGIMFDLLVIPMLLFKPTRKIAVVLSIFFHIGNSITFQIGTFPYMMLATLVFFYKPDKIEKWFLKREIIGKHPAVSFANIRKRITLIGLAVIASLQIGIPLRHYFYKDAVLWTEEGHRLSWRMMLRSKSGTIHFKIINNNSGKTFTDFPNKNLSRSQQRYLPTHPDMIYQYVQFLKKKYGSDIKIFASSAVSLNYRRAQVFVKPDVDLAKIEWNRFSHSEWIADGPKGLSIWE